MKDDVLRVRVTGAWKERVSQCAKEHGFGIAELVRMATEETVIRLEEGESATFRHFAGWRRLVDAKK